MLSGNIDPIHKSQHAIFNKLKAYIESKLGLLIGIFASGYSKAGLMVSNKVISGVKS